MTQKNSNQSKPKTADRKASMPEQDETVQDAQIRDDVETQGATAAKFTAKAATSVADLAEEMARGTDSVGFTDEAEETLHDAHAGYNLDSIMRIPVSIQVVLGSASMPVANLMKLGRGAVVPLDHRVGEPVDVVVNGRVVARGEVVVVEDDNSRFGVSLTEIVTSQSASAGF